ncbi:ADP-heptose synthase sugar kinase subunit [Leptospira ryugenii]|uniref:ADP-heptose synthase sugar kinase subunit n=1 Tax=Leptospira ryugenii TaxID=1917863 RepID=A0A2P2DWU4_9LEPT|nr:D-glycero-beta-D-manno-heptose-7-phosphate kinase [Leptospira ryugenii]GBF49040.1 ADP-heptose synthase sugar kinase subunit [Leptospira ryugenii]
MHLKIQESKLNQCFETLAKTKILVIGDLILDEYLFGSVDRISPEAPVPVVWVRREDHKLGGSGNVVCNLSSLGVSSLIFGRIGQDSWATKMRDIFDTTITAPKELELTVSPNLPTIVKTRILAAQQQICRVDREEIRPLTIEEEDSIITRLREKISECSAVIISDYDKGYLTKRLIQETIRLAKEKNIFVTVDPQVGHFFEYQDVHLMTPNHHEAGKALGRKLSNELEVEDALKEIANRLGSDAMMITRGEKGMSIFDRKKNSFFHIPTVAREVFDVTGAGDTVISIYTAFLAAGMSVEESSLIANASAGIVVGKVGAATVSKEEIRRSLFELNVLESL